MDGVCEIGLPGTAAELRIQHSFRERPGMTIYSDTDP